MKLLNEFLDVHTNSAMEEFEQEISTDENKDYRRGFRAGVLFSYLHMKSHIKDFNDAATEQSTD